MLGDSSKRLLSASELARGVAETFTQTTFIDVESANRIVLNRVEETIASRVSPFQRIDIFRTPHFGLILALDGIIQVAEVDEHFYHELLIHPACLMAPALGSVLIMGGGDGCAARELLRYRDFNDIDMVEIDRDVLDLCAEHFREINRGALKDPRVNLIVEEGEAWLAAHPEKRYDLIIADLTEPYDLTGLSGDLSKRIFSAPFYEMLKGHMTPGAVLVIQTGAITHLPEVDHYHRTIIEDLCGSFRSVATAYKYIHSFDAIWSITFASDRDLDVHSIDVDERLKELGITNLRYYDGAAHEAVFHPTPEVRDLFR